MVPLSQPMVNEKLCPNYASQCKVWAEYGMHDARGPRLATITLLIYGKMQSQKNFNVCCDKPVSFNIKICNFPCGINYHGRPTYKKTSNQCGNTHHPINRRSYQGTSFVKFKTWNFQQQASRLTFLLRAFGLLSEAILADVCLEKWEVTT